MSRVHAYLSETLPKAIRLWFWLCVIAVFKPVAASDDMALESCEQLLQHDQAVWTENGQRLVASPATPYRGRRGRNGFRYEASNSEVELRWTSVVAPAGDLSELEIVLYRNNKPVSQWAFGNECELLAVNSIVYNDEGVALSLHITRQGFPTLEQPLNPPLPEVTPRLDPGAVRVALVDSGVNYTLPMINSRLARDESGQLLSKDYWDNDGLPFDAHPTGSDFRVARHGTRTASILLREAPDVALISYRYPRPDMSRMTQLVEHASVNNVAIVGLPLGGNREDQWLAFAEAARQHPHILFIASAGNNGRNIDQQPVYPASLSLDNLLVVTSADDFVVPAERVNWGRTSVDYLLPAEQLSAIDFDGSEVAVSGSSYAVPRAVAMAARMKQANPNWQAPELIAEFSRRYADGASARYVNGGYIADPLLEEGIFNAITAKSGISFAPLKQTDDSAYQLPLAIWALGNYWHSDEIRQTTEQAASILAQCGIAMQAVTLQRVSAADRLMDLSVSNAHSLFGKLRPSGQRHPIAIVFARDTVMLEAFDGEAFGRGNTRRRPWMRDSVWLTSGIRDPGVALAHELFHVLANSGAHNKIRGNLMQAFTNSEQTDLTQEQCQQASETALAAGLIE